MNYVLSFIILTLVCRGHTMSLYSILYSEINFLILNHPLSKLHEPPNPARVSSTSGLVLLALDKHKIHRTVINVDILNVCVCVFVPFNHKRCVGAVIIYLLVVSYHRRAWHFRDHKVSVPRSLQSTVESRGNRVDARVKGKNIQ